MDNIKVKVDSSTTKVRIGQQNALKVISSSSGGGKASFADVANSVIGGIASVTKLTVSGNVEITGISTFNNDVYITDSDLFVKNVIIDGNVSISGTFFYANYEENGVAYFNTAGILSSTNSPNQSQIDYSNNILTVNNSGIPSWTDTIDGGDY